MLPSRLGAAAFLGLFALGSVALKTTLLESGGRGEVLSKGTQAPDFALPDTSGREVSMTGVAREHKVVLINFWATWCVPCRLEMPDMKKLHDAYHAAGLEILAVSEDHERQALTDYLEKHPVPFPVLVDDGTVAKRYGVDVFPTSILVDPDGKVIMAGTALDGWMQAQVFQLTKAGAK